MAVFGNAGVRYPVPEDYWNPDAGGGPISRTPLVAAPARAGNIVARSPNAIVPDAQPGGASDWSYLHNKMYLPDGRLVDRDSVPNQPYQPLPWSVPGLDGFAASPAGGKAGVFLIIGTLALVGAGAFAAVRGR